MADLLYVNGRLVDLKPNQVIALTVNVINLGDLTTKQVSHTNQITVPKTEANDITFGYASNENSRTSKPYTFLPCRLLMGGIETIPNGTCLVKSFNDGYVLNILDGLFDVFDTFNGRKLSEIEPIANSGWAPSHIDAARTNTEGIISAVVFWGMPTSYGSIIYHPNYFLPCFFYHTLIKKIFEYSGVTLSGDILTDTRFTDLVVSYPNDKFTAPDFNIDTQAEKSVMQSETGHLTGDERLLTFDVLGYGTYWNTSTNEFTFPFTVNADILVKISIDAYNFGDGTSITFTLLKNGSYVSATGVTTTTSTSPTANQLTISINDDFNSGDVLTVVITTDATVTGCDYDIFQSNTVTFFRVTQTTSPARALVYWNSQFDKVDATSLVRDFMTRFGIIPKLKNGVLYLKTIEEILSDRANVNDWSGKLVNRHAKSIDFKTTYGQNNYFRYSNQVNDETLGEGNMTVANTTLPVNKTAFTSVFENCVTDLRAGYNVAQIIAYDEDSAGIEDINNSPGIKLLTLKARTTESAITFDVTARTDYKLAYFVDADQAKDTSFEYFIGQFMPKFQAALQKNKVIMKEYNLDANDIRAFDNQKMMWDGEGYYLVNKIPNFVNGKISTVELFKIW